MWKLLVLFFIGFANAGYYEELTAKQVPEIMKKQPKWVAGYNPYFAGKSAAEMRHLLGAKVDKTHKVPQKFVDVKPATIPATFDARSQWSNCPSIGFIRDQGQCGSCWAVSTSEVMTDRTCIDSAGANQPYISDDDVLSCCPYCGSGCDGGYPYSALEWWNQYGVVTGGPYNSHQGCQPYEIPPTGWPGPTNTPACKSYCESGYNANSYASDKHFGGTYYQVNGGVSGYQTEIMTNGPVATVFDVYEDFYNYVSGIYVHTYGSYEGSHAVKILGWGVDNNQPYWLVANSWNATWGMGGFFKIDRGNNDCGFESYVYAGTAKS